MHNHNSFETNKYSNIQSGIRNICLSPSYIVWSDHQVTASDQITQSKSVQLHSDQFNRSKHWDHSDSSVTSPKAQISSSYSKILNLWDHLNHINYSCTQSLLPLKPFCSLTPYIQSICSFHTVHSDHWNPSDHSNQSKHFNHSDHSNISDHFKHSDLTLNTTQPL